ncbi:hypothetical protein [Nocardia harenae]|uniref:hypothetical protein n=1 Tax=Nocardia harenae TaxID=358707 RepID=UPI000829CEA6|nr:hypothetical protein [Nocardia harenae]
MIVIARDSTFSGPEKLVRRWFESWHGPDRGLGGLAVFGCELPGVAGGPGRRADVLVWTPGHCTVVEIAGLRRSQSGVLDTGERWRIGSAPADLDLPVAGLTPDVRAAQTATGLRARLKRAGLPDLVGELAVLVTAPGSAVTHPEPLEPVGVIVAGRADPDAVERYFRRQGAALWDVAALTAAFTELELGDLLPPVEVLEREGFTAAGEISAAEVAAQGAGTPAAEPASGGGGVAPPGSDAGGGQGVVAEPSARVAGESDDVAATPATRVLADDARDPASADDDREPASPDDDIEPTFADDDLEPDDPRRANSAAPERVPAMAVAAPSRPPWLAPIPPLPERPRRAAARMAEPSAITEVDTPRPAPSAAGRAEPVPGAAAAGQPGWAGARNAAPAQTWRSQQAAAGPAQSAADASGVAARAPLTGTASVPHSTARPPASPPFAQQKPHANGVRLTRNPDPQPTQRPRPTPPPAEQRPPRRFEYSADPRPLRPRAHYSPPPTRGAKLRAAFDTESWPRFQIGGTAVLLALAAVVAVFFVVVHVAGENRPALADYAAMCDEPRPFGGAAEPKPGPVGVYAARDLNALSPPNDPALPRAARPEDVQWVACATRTGIGQPVATCRNQDGSELALIAGRYRLTVYEARTGRTVSSADVPGDWFAPGTIPIGDPCAAAAGASPDQPGQRFGRPAPGQLRQFLTDAARTRGLPS